MRGRTIDLQVNSYYQSSFPRVRFRQREHHGQSGCDINASYFKCPDNLQVYIVPYSYLTFLGNSLELSACCLGINPFGPKLEWVLHDTVGFTMLHPGEGLQANRHLKEVGLKFLY